METDIYMRPVRVCEKLNLTPNQIRSLVWDKQLETVKVGGVILFYTAEVEAYAAKHRPPPVEQVITSPVNTVHGMP